MSSPSEHSDRLIEFARKQLGRLDKYLDAVHERGDEDAVHDFRVASRRLQEPVQVMAHWTSRRAANKLQKRLKRLRQALRDVRDLDVFFESLGEPATTPQLEPADRDLLEQQLLARRRRKLAKARSELLGAKPQKVQDQADDLIAVFRDRSVEEPAAVLDAVGEQWRQRVSAVVTQRPTASGVDLHICRIQLKKLRYTTELLRRMEERKKGSFVGELAAMQDLLGRWNDHLFAVTELTRCATRRKLLSDSARFSASLLRCAAERAEQAETARSEALARWKQLVHVIETEGAKRERAVAV